MHTLRILSVLVVLPFSLLRAQSGPEPPPPAPPPAPEAAPGEAARALAAKQAELSAIAQHITELQSQAETNETVKVAKDGYRVALRTEMVRAAPALEPDITRQAALVDELSEKPSTAKEIDAPKATELQTKLAEYRALHEKLTPVEQGVQTAPVVKEARGKYYDTLIAEMERLEPKVQELLAKHRELVAVIRELAAQAHTG
jgi:hypothetical protein